YLLRPNPASPAPQPKSLPYAYTGHKGVVLSVAWSSDGKRIASTSAILVSTSKEVASFDGDVQVWDASSGTHLLTYTRHTAVVWSAAWSPDGKRIASAVWDKIVRVWDASNGTSLLTYTLHTAAVRSVAWSPDGKRIASASDDKTVQVWDASSGTPLFS